MTTDTVREIKMIKRLTLIDFICRPSPLLRQPILRRTYCLNSQEQVADFLAVRLNGSPELRDINISDVVGETCYGRSSKDLSFVGRFSLKYEYFFV